MDFLDIASKFGVPVAVMVAMGAFFWTIVRWLKPRADKVIDAHLEFVASIKKNSDENSALLNTLLEKSVCNYKEIHDGRKL